MKLSPALERRVLQIAGELPPAPPRGKKLRGPGLVGPAFSDPCVFWVPLLTASEANSRCWRARSARTQAARRAVSRAFGPRLRALAPVAEWYHANGTVRAVLTRLGGRKLDYVNLCSSLKACEDIVALFLGADDGDPRWQPEYRQEPGGPCGVRIELETKGA